ncbi:head maturation protease, ClpP-related [Butyricicoccus sp. AM78-15b2TA]|mgnify:FL=1|jgi:ATP-dependent protease ClpP protease subunit|uniref:head maturation protease, ClpP-related n=1 Tax=Butyricicoccus sp. AM78-15b2TA TaxID=3002516 RepID=UPI002055D085|nr:head maturation protease, ClpP-related [Butyricicoccus sp. AM78-15b2TA]DAT95592.1 MAG TPA: Putative ATP dependent Clp protease [Caudoviricetes sp.]
MRYSLNGRIVADDDAPVLRWWGLSAVCPADIRQAIAENPADEEFTLEINSPGGSVFAGFEMYSVLRRASRDGVRIRAEVQSLAGSAASVAMVGADTVACSPVAQVMIHLPLTVTEGNQNVHRESVQMLESITESIIAGYERKVANKTSPAALRRLMDRETFLSARTALDAGLVDEIIEEPQSGEPVDPANIYNAVGALPDMDKLRAAYNAAKSQSQEPEPQPPVSNLNTARKRAIAIAEAELRAVVV